MDPLAELAYDFTPYRYGFNNPLFWGDASGLFETWGDAFAYKKANKLSGASIEYDSDANLFKIIDGGVTITQVGNMINKMYMIGEDMHLSQTPAGGEGGSSSGSKNDNAQQVSIPIPLMLATGALEGMVLDLSIPDPTDGVPYKWIGYAITAIVAAIIVHSYGDDVVDYASGHFDSMGQRWDNNGKLEPEEEAYLKEKLKDGTITKVEKQKLKKHGKNTGEKPTRKSKGKKGKK